MPALDTPVCDFGRPIVPFSLPGVDDRAHSKEDCRGPRGTLVIFICNHCPYVKAVLPRLLADTRELLEVGVASVAIMSNDVSAYPADSFDNMCRLADQLQFPFPYLYDASQEVAHTYGAVCTPDFFGYNAAGLLQYRGRLDAGRLDAPPPGSRRELFEAMSAVAATGQGPREQTPSTGCSIKWLRGRG